jgi:hypothetical protein
MDLKRYMPILQVSVPLFGILAIGNLVAARAFGRIPAWTSESPNWISQSEIMTGSRAAGVVHTMASQKSGVINLVLGQSTAYTDVDCQEMERQCGVPSRWFSIGGRGNSFVKMESGLSPVFFGGLHPHICVLIVDPTDLIGYPMFMKVPGKTKPVEAAALNWKDKSSVWMFLNRDYANSLIQVACDKGREHIMDKIGLPLDVVYMPDSDPTENPIPLSGKQAPEVLALALESYEHLRYYSPDTYRSDGEQALAFLKLVAECRHLGAKVVVMIAPESETLRARIPHEAMDCMEQLFYKARKGGDLTVFDMRNTQPETSMNDFMHLNQIGRKSNTEAFIRLMKATPGQDYCAVK